MAFLCCHHSSSSSVGFFDRIGDSNRVEVMKILIVLAILVLAASPVIAWSANAEDKLQDKYMIGKFSKIHGFLILQKYSLKDCQEALKRLGDKDLNCIPVSNSEH